jgi:Ca2+-binding EF-hand superfamily protein
MFSKKLTAALVLASATITGFVVPADAQEGTQDDFMIIFKMKSMDKDKDGMISKKEFIAAMEKAFDMKAKEMGAKGGMLTEAQLELLFRSLYHGG